jgi:hypothetical protein
LPFVKTSVDLIGGFRSLSEYEIFRLATPQIDRVYLQKAFTGEFFDAKSKSAAIKAVDSIRQYSLLHSGRLLSLQDY